VRVHFAPHLGDPPSADALRRLCDLIGPYGWHLEVHTMGTGVLHFADHYPQLPLRIVLDHMARFPLPVDRSPAEHRTVLDLLGEDDVWIKLSGADRVSRKLPAMTDGLALARSLFEHRPDRCVWGSDFPHPNTHGFMPADRDLVNGLALIAPTDDERRLLLVDNPTTCFGFGVESADHDPRSE
jgi:predicted TIM-barrel fold metal-dependent hydrolase